MNDVERLLTVLARDPGDDTAWLALADGLAEQGEDARSELVRLQLRLRRELDSPEWPAWEQRLRQLWTEGVSPCQPLFQGPIGLKFVLVPPGVFEMGAQDEEKWMDPDEMPRRKIRLTRGFWLGAYPVTQAQWQAVAGDNPAHHRGDNLPVERVSHGDCQDFCGRLSKKLGRLVRLPTEAEWEYACRAGTRTSFCSGEGVEALRLVGWCSYSGDWDGSGGTQEVGRLRGNSLGLFDMHGNVWEWCADWYAGKHDEAGPDHDPTGAESGETRVLRGGSWRGGPWFCRSAERRAIDPWAAEINVGFRVAMDPG